MTTPVAPLDPDSARGRELAAELTVALDEVAEAIEQRRREREKRKTAAEAA
jgi:hypothetical protein